MGGEWLAHHFDELDDLTKEHRLAGRKRPYQVMITRNRMEMGEGEDVNNILLTPRSLRREKLGLRGFLSLTRGEDSDDDEENQDGGADGADTPLKSTSGTSTLVPLPQAQRMQIAASNGVKTVFCEPEGETIEQEKKRWLAIRTRALSDRASGTAALELLDYKAVVASSTMSEPTFLFYIALRPISFIIPLYMELNNLAKSIGRCARRLRSRLLKLRNDRQRMKQAAILKRKENLSGLTKRVAEWTPLLPHLFESVATTQKVAKEVWGDLQKEEDGRAVVLRQEVQEEFLRTQQRINIAERLLVDFRARVEQYHRMHEPDYFFPGDTRKQFKNLDQVIGAVRDVSGRMSVRVGVEGRV